MIIVIIVIIVSIIIIIIVIIVCYIILGLSQDPQNLSRGSFVVSSEGMALEMQRMQADKAKWGLGLQVCGASHGGGLP